MPNPPYARTWIQNTPTGVPGTRIPYVSLLDTMQRYLFEVTNFLGSNGLTIQFSSNSIVAGAGNNIAASTNWVRNTGSGAQSWMILLDGNGGQFLVAYTGSSDVIAYLAYSPGALFTGTGSTSRPAASDQMLMMSTDSLVSGTASSMDRIWHCVVSSDAKAYRFVVASSSWVIGPLVAIDEITPCYYGPSVSVHPVVAWSHLTGNAIENAGNLFSANRKNITRTISGVTSIDSTAQFRVTSAQGDIGFLQYANNEKKTLLQGGLGYPASQMYLCASSIGYYGTVPDLFMGCAFGYSAVNYTGLPFGTSYAWFQVGMFLWPNPSQLPPMMI